MNNIWSLPKLVHCHLNIDFACTDNFPVPTLISSTLKYLYLRDIQNGNTALALLSKHTPHLQHCSLISTIDIYEEDLHSVIPAILTLNISFALSEESKVIRFLQKMPNLYQLTMKLGALLVNGQKLEQIIHDHLPKLRKFRFAMDFYFDDDNHLEHQVDQLLNTFQSRFWLEEHQWFVQIHWKLDGTAVMLYSLPYAFEYFDVDALGLFKSTCPDDDDFGGYNQVRIFDYYLPSYADLVLSRITFNNIRKLTISFPIDDHFWLVFLSLDRCRSLRVFFDNWDADCQSQLQKLLDRAPLLHSLHINEDSLSFVKLSLFESRNTSISKLDLCQPEQPYNNKACAKLSFSSLVIQCDRLRINVRNRICILDFINALPNLRVLSVQCLDDGYEEKKEDELVEWLRQYLPSSCTITRDKFFSDVIHLWIR
jgi:hypothetical protein